jgi:hypothetical protein
MKKILFLLVALLIVPVMPAQAQTSASVKDDKGKEKSILSIVENANGKEKPIAATSAQIVDINGNLEVTISKEVLMDRIRKEYPQFKSQVDLQGKIEVLQKALVDQEKLLTLLKQNAMNKSDKEAFYAGILSFIKAVKEDPGLRAQANNLVIEYALKYGASSSSPNTVGPEYYLLTNLNTSLLSAKEELSDLKGTSFSISMVAFIKTKLSDDDRVHIRNFDTYKDREVYSVPRWVTTLSAPDAEKLANLKVMADDYNSKAPNYFTNFKTELLQNFPEVDCIIVQKTKLEEFLNDSSIKNNLTTAVKNDIAVVISKYESLITILKTIKQDVGSWTIDTPFAVMEEAKNLVAVVNDMLKVFNNFKSSSTALAIGKLTTKTLSLADSFKTCYDALLSSAKAVGSASGILKDQQLKFDSTTALEKEVSSFGIETLPTTGFIKLEGAGPRENGDKIEIDLILRMPTKDKGNSDAAGGSTSENNEILETRTLTMQIIGLRSEVVAGIILADSFSENGFTPLEDRRFLYAPAVSLLLKIGSRNSNLYNDFIDFGFGVAISTPDFNTDGTPEFGAGLMFTAFKDILSVGINYNVTLDTPYWSFGINLPFALPGVPINDPK